MSDWSQQAQSKDGKGMSDRDAGSPVHPCVENAKLLPVLDAIEHTVVDPEVQVALATPPVESALTVAEPTPPIEHELRVAPPAVTEEE